MSLLDALETRAVGESSGAAAAAADDEDRGGQAPFDDAVQVFRDLLEITQRWDQVYGRQAGAYGDPPIALFLTDADELAERLESGGRLSAEARELADWVIVPITGGGDGGARRPSSSTVDVADECKPALQLQWRSSTA